MEFNRIPMKKWKKLDVPKQGRIYSAEPLATVTKGLAGVSFNQAATNIIISHGLLTKYCDLYQSGNEFALADGNDFTVCIYPRGSGAKKTAYARITNAAITKKIYAATKCRVFRVSVQDSFVVLTPAYDLEH